MERAPLEVEIVVGLLDGTVKLKEIKRLLDRGIAQRISSQQAHAASSLALRYRVAISIPVHLLCGQENTTEVQNSTFRYPGMAIQRLKLSETLPLSFYLLSLIYAEGL